MMRTFVLAFALPLMLFGNPLYAESRAEQANELSEPVASNRENSLPSQTISKDQSNSAREESETLEQFPVAVSSDQQDQHAPESAEGKIESTQTNVSVNKNRELNAGVSPERWGVVFITLIGMVFFIVLVAWMVKRFGGLRVAGMRDMKVISAMPVGNREKVALVEVRGQEFLLGVTTHTITHLHTFDGTRSGDPVEPAKSPFAEKLQAVMMPGKGEASEKGAERVEETKS